MKFKFTLPLFVLLSVICLNLSAIAETDESVEPADSYSLVVNGEKMPLFTDRDINLPENAGSAKVRLEVNPEKSFSYGEIELKYPRYFTFESEFPDEGVRLWSLSGKKAVLMIQRYPVKMDHSVMAQQLLPSFGRGNSTLSSCEMTLHGEKQKGSRLVIRIGEGVIAQNIYSFDIASGSLLLIMQDTLDENGSNSAEFKAFFEMFVRTFKIIRN